MNYLLRYATNDMHEKEKSTNISRFNSLEKRLPRMPFPPIMKGSNFDYESVLEEHVRDLEAVRPNTMLTS